MLPSSLEVCCCIRDYGVGLGIWNLVGPWLHDDVLYVCVRFRVGDCRLRSAPAMDRDEEMGHGDRSLLFIGDEDDDLGADRDGGSPPTSSSDEGSFSERSDDDDARAARGGARRRRCGGGGGDGPDDGQKGTWPQSYRFVDLITQPIRRLISFPDLFSMQYNGLINSYVSRRQSIDMLSLVPSPTVSTLMAASPSLTKFGSSFIKAGSSFFLKKGEGSQLPLTRPLLPPSLSQLSQSSLHQPPVKQSADNLVGMPPRPTAAHEADFPDRPSRACLKSDYIELPPPASKCSRGQSIINGAFS